jgi:hypothetical protein
MTGVEEEYRNELRLKFRANAKPLDSGSARKSAHPGMTGWIHGAFAFGVLVKSTSGHCCAGNAHSLPVIRSTVIA